MEKNEKIDEKQVKVILKNYIHFRDSGKEQMDQLFDRIRQSERVYQVVCEKTNYNSKIDGERGKRIQENINELYESLEMIEKKQIICQRVWIIYQSLEQREFGIIKDLYVDGIKYERAMQNSGYVKSSFERVRQKALQLIIDMYNQKYAEQDVD